MRPRVAPGGIHHPRREIDPHHFTRRDLPGDALQLPAGAAARIQHPGDARQPATHLRERLVEDGRGERADEGVGHLRHPVELLDQMVVLGGPLQQDRPLVSQGEERAEPRAIPRRWHLPRYGAGQQARAPQPLETALEGRVAVRVL